MSTPKRSGLTKGNGSYLAIAIVIAIATVMWIYLYRTHPAAPPPLGRNTGTGWWGWFDQSKYLQISEQWSQHDYLNPDKFYPPLFPGIVGLLWPLFHQHGYAVISYLCCIYFFGTLLLIFRRYPHPFLAALSIALSYGFNRSFFDQWVIPWTTNLSSALLIAMAWILWNQDRQMKANERPFDQSQTNPRRDLTLALTICALMPALRPLEIIPCLIILTGITINTGRQIRVRSIDPAMRHPCNQFVGLRATRLLYFLPCILPGTIVGITYLAHNYYSFGSLQPAYAKAVDNIGFNLSDFGFKYWSLMLDSSTFGMNNGHLAFSVPWYTAMIALAITGIFWMSLPHRYLILAALTSQASYVTYNDLVPTGLFTYNNIHYFVWSMAVIGTASMATGIILIKAFYSKQAKSKAIVATILTAMLSVLLYYYRPSIDATSVNLSEWSVSCKTNLNHTNATLTAEYRGRKLGNNSSSRLIIFQTPIASPPEHIHVIDANQMHLDINERSLVYRKDWRLVNQKVENDNVIGILLQHPMALKGMKINLRSGSDSKLVLQKQFCSKYV